MTWKYLITQIAKFMGPTWGPPGSCQPQMGPMLVPWTFLSGIDINKGNPLVNVLFLGIEQTKKSALEKVMAWGKTDDKWLNEPIMNQVTDRCKHHQASI